MRSLASGRRLPLVLLVVAIFFAATTAGLAFLRGSSPGAEGASGSRCGATDGGPADYVVSGLRGTVVAGLTVRPAPAGGDRAALELQLLSPQGPLAGRRPVLVPSRPGSSPIALSESSTPGCYSGRGTLAPGQALHVQGVSEAGGPLAMRLPARVRPAAALVRRARAVTRTLAGVHERQRVSPSDGAPPVVLDVRYHGRSVTERSATGVTRSPQPAWRQTLFWMFPAGIGIPRRVGTERHDGRTLAVVTGTLRDVEGFIRLAIDPRTGHVERMRFLAAGHIMYSDYDDFRPAG